MFKLKIPDSWAAIKLGELFEITSSKRVLESQWTKQGVPFYRAREIVKIEKNGFVNNELFISNEMYEDFVKKYGIPNEGDLLVTAVGTLGICYIVKGNDRFYFKDGNIIWLKNHFNLNPKFFYYGFKSHLIKSQIESSQGSTVGTYTIIKAKGTNFVLPPMAEQKRIVSKIESTYEKIKVVEDTVTKAEELIEKYRETLLQKAFRGELVKQDPNDEPASKLLERIRAERAQASDSKKKKKDDLPPIKPEEIPFDIPKSWEWVRIGSIASEVSYGSSAKTNDNSTGVPVLRMGNIQKGKLDYTNLKYLPKSHDEFPNLFLESGDILFNRTNSPELVGKAAVFETFDGPVSFASYLIRLRVKSEVVHPFFVSTFINSKYGREWVESVMVQQVGQANVNGTKLKESLLPLPPMLEQKRIVKCLTKFETISKVVGSKLAEINKAKLQIRDAILEHAFSGKLVRQDSSEGTGEDLLSHLTKINAEIKQQEKSTSSTTKARKKK